MYLKRRARRVLTHCGDRGGSRSSHLLPESETMTCGPTSPVHTLTRYDLETTHSMIRGASLGYVSHIPSTIWSRTQILYCTEVHLICGYFSGLHTWQFHLKKAHRPPALCFPPVGGMVLFAQLINHKKNPDQH